MPEHGVLAAGEAFVEAPEGALVKELLSQAGWKTDEPWTPLRRDLFEPVDDPGVRNEVVGRDIVNLRVEVQRASFGNSKFTEESWVAMAGGVPYADAACLLAFDDRGTAVVTDTAGRLLSRARPRYANLDRLPLSFAPEPPTWRALPPTRPPVSFHSRRGEIDPGTLDNNRELSPRIRC